MALQDGPDYNTATVCKVQLYSFRRSNKHDEMAGLRKWSKQNKKVVFKCFFEALGWCRHLKSCKENAMFGSLENTLRSKSGYLRLSYTFAGFLRQNDTVLGFKL